jgi:rsbT antagonist protein RsbS
MAVPILKQGSNLIVSVPSTVTDLELRDLQEGLLKQVGELRCTGVVLDVAALDVLDSFATRILRTIAEATRLRGAQTILVGIQPDVAFAMVQLGLTSRFEGVTTALDLEEGLVELDRLARDRNARDGRASDGSASNWSARGKGAGRGR